MLDDLLRANAEYASGFTLKDLPGKAAKGVAVVTCMDTRIDPLTVFQLQPGDAKFIRNAGGRVTTDVLRSLILAVAFLEVTEIAVMQHTRCALAGHFDEDLRNRLPEPMAAGAKSWELLAMPDPAVALEADIELVRSCPALPKGLRVEGWRYDVDTGRVSRLVR